MRLYPLLFAVLLVSASLRLAADEVETKPADESERPRAVSLVRLIAAPECHADKIVRVRGVVHIEFEHCALYLSPFDEAHGIWENAIWISGPAIDPEKSARFNRKAVMVEGRFDPKETGHFGAFQNGGLYGVDVLTPLRME